MTYPDDHPFSPNYKSKLAPAPIYGTPPKPTRIHRKRAVSDETAAKFKQSGPQP